ncbi:hypothetical protein BASA61_008194 [Batrachochytrium salamandrivorans]|nr:hypothetical protein BASA61_008194 [Batrachochytrium salamandrivorans]
MSVRRQLASSLLAARLFRPVSYAAATSARISASRMYASQSIEDVVKARRLAVSRIDTQEQYRQPRLTELLKRCF